MTEHTAQAHVETYDTPISLSHLVRTLKSYAAVILLAVTAVAIGYFVFALGRYLTSPPQRITTQNFRLTFQGAEDAVFPNGEKFNPADIVATPILTEVFQRNNLGRYTSINDFTRSVFVLEANHEYERLAAEYAARLADPKISSIDRERIDREWQAKRAALAKNDYSINYARYLQVIPETLVRKTLSDILIAWAAHTVRDKHVLEYQISVLTPEVLSVDVPSNDPVIRLHVLRSRIARVLENIVDLAKVPGATLARTRDERLSLGEIAIRLDETLRFRVDPLTVTARSATTNPALTTRFLETQLAFDERRLAVLQAVAETERQALALYAGTASSGSAQTASGAQSSADGGNARNTSARKPEGETLMPQLSDSFLDRLVTLTSQTADSKYRQTIIDNYRRAEQQVIPAQEAVAYDRDLLNQMKTAVPSTTTTPAELTAATAEIQNDVRRLIQQVDEISQSVSRNLSATAEIYSTTDVPVTRVERAVTLSRLFLGGIVVVLISIPVIIVLCLLHNRVREEEAAERTELTPEPSGA